MPNIQETLAKFEALQKTKAALETEKALLDKEKAALLTKLKDVHAELDFDNLDDNIAALEDKILNTIEQLRIPEELVNELNDRSK
jgi:chromosome segregation ATPase